MLCVGAMGTLLNMRGVSFKRSFEELNISNPQMVLGVHRDYIKAGVEIIETNTFEANIVRLRDFGLEKKVREINLKGVKITLEARVKEGRCLWQGPWDLLENRMLQGVESQTMKSRIYSRSKRKLC